MIARNSGLTTSTSIKCNLSPPNLKRSYTRSASRATPPRVLRRLIQKNITARRRFAADQTERDGIRHIAPFLLFTGEAEMPVGTTAEPLIISKDEIILHKYFLPNAPDTQIKHTWGALKEARVDRCVGYVSRQDARSTGCTAPFTADEEKTLDE
jgi:hypothetical protein